MFKKITILSLYIIAFTYIQALDKKRLTPENLAKLTTAYVTAHGHATLPQNLYSTQKPELNDRKQKSKKSGYLTAKQRRRQSQEDIQSDLDMLRE